MTNVLSDDSIINTRAGFKAENRSKFSAHFETQIGDRPCYFEHIPRRITAGGSVDVSKIDGMLAQLRAGAAVAAGKTAPVMTPSDTREAYGTDVVDFTTVLKNSLNQVNNSQQHAAKLTQDFEMGAQGANLTEAMISMQKATISLQYTVQVRNKIVMAYQDIMNMPV